MRKLANEEIGKLGNEGRRGVFCGKCNVLGILLRIIQNEKKGGKRLLFSDITLTLRSPFALPSVRLRDGFEVAPSCF